MKSKKNNVKRIVYSLSEFCEMIGISKPTAYKWIKEGIIKVKRVGREYYVPASEIKRLFGEDILEDLE